MEGDRQQEIQRRLADLVTRHRDLDAAIAQLAAESYVDELQMRRLKKQKLFLKDAIARLQSSLIPDLDA